MLLMTTDVSARKEFDCGKARMQKNIASKALGSTGAHQLRLSDDVAALHVPNPKADGQAA